MNAVTCPGICCRSFPVGDGGRDAIVANLWSARYEAGPDGFRLAHPTSRENSYIRDMLVPAPTPAGKSQPHYSCVFFDGARCTAYAERPAYMCGAFPYGEACEHCSIGYTVGSAAPWARVEETGIFTPWESEAGL